MTDATPKRGAKANGLTPEALKTALESLDGWEVVAGKLSQSWTFASFSAAFAFLTRVALLSEKLDHHPDIYHAYRTVTLTLISHDVGALTARDVRFARKISALETG